MEAVKIVEKAHVGRSPQKTRNAKEPEGLQPEIIGRKIINGRIHQQYSFSHDQSIPKKKFEGKTPFCFSGEAGNNVSAKIIKKHSKRTGYLV